MVNIKKKALTAVAAISLIASAATPTLIASTALVTVGTTHAEAACYGFGNYKTCSDGSTYSKFGNSFYGSNSKTGTSWGGSTYGNTTYGYSNYSFGSGKNWTYSYYGNSGYGSTYSY